MKMNKKSVIEEIDNFDDVKKDEAESKRTSQKIKEKKLKQEKDAEDNIQTEMTVFDYDDG